MAITILPKDEQPNQFGNAISQGLQMLAQQKLGQMQQRNQSFGLEALGIPQSEAAALSKLPQELQSVVLKNYLQGAESAGLDQALGGINGQQGPGFAQQQPAFAQQAQQQNGNQSSQLSQVLNRPRLSPEHRLKVEALKQQREMATTRENAKETLPVYRDIIKASQAAHDSEKSLSRMEKLIDSGRLTNPTFHNFLKSLSHGFWGVGIDLHNLESAESQEFSKLSNNFVKHAKDIFGGRLTDTDLKTFMQTLPTLSNSDDGKRRIINVLRSENQAAKIKKEALDSILKANGGKRPANLEFLIEEAVGPQLDELSKQFVDSLPSKKRNVVQKINDKLSPF